MSSNQQPAPDIQPDTRTHRKIERLAEHRRARTGSLAADMQVSFEFFPPKTDKGEQTLWQSIRKLEPLGPRFVSVTYGAGGSTRERTHKAVRRIREETSLTPAAHLTCVGATRAEVDEVVAGYRDADIRHIVALRGDPPGGEERFRPHPDGYQSGADLVQGIKRIGDFEVSVAAYPEVHPDAASPEADLDNLKRKIDNGAERAITQFFFNADDYFRFLDRARAADITVPIVPGVLPVTNFAKLCNFAAMCGANIPRWLADLFDDLDDSPEVRRLVAATVAAEMCTTLAEQGINEFHFYTLNRSELVRAICRILGIYPNARENEQLQSQQG